MFGIPFSMLLSRRGQRQFTRSNVDDIEEFTAHLARLNNLTSEEAVQQSDEQPSDLSNCRRLMLEVNRRRVQNLSGAEIWLFIIARVLVGFALGVFAMIYVPAVAVNLAWPALGIGVVAFLIASRGLARKRQAELAD